MMGFEYAVVIEKATDNYCAYVPDRAVWQRVRHERKPFSRF